MDTSKQYDKFAEKYIDASYRLRGMETSLKIYWDIIKTFSLKGKIIMDVGCGAGFDLKKFQELGAIIYGIDSSEKEIECAKESFLESVVQVVSFDKQLPFNDKYFDFIFSRYAVQHSLKIKPILKEFNRLLKTNGILLLLITHPVRQFKEKRRKGKNYFKQEIVQSTFFNGEMTLEEPTHTFAKYLNADILKMFDLVNFIEEQDETVEYVDGDVYPAFMILQFRKR